MSGATFYLCTLATSSQIPHDRLQQLQQLQQLNKDFRNLHDNLVYHETHVTGPFTKALLDQMLAVKIQVSDIVIDLGCAEQKEKDGLCYVLMVEELRLGYDILVKGMEWYVEAERKVVNEESLFG